MQSDLDKVGPNCPTLWGTQDDGRPGWQRVVRRWLGLRSPALSALCHWGSILAPVSNSKGGVNLFSKASRRYVGLSRSRQPETLAPMWCSVGHPTSLNGLSDSIHPNGARDPPRKTAPRCKMAKVAGWGSC